MRYFLLSILCLFPFSSHADEGGGEGGSSGTAFLGSGGYSPEAHYFSMTLEEYYSSRGNANFLFFLYQEYLKSIK